MARATWDLLLDDEDETGNELPLPPLVEANDSTAPAAAAPSAKVKPKLSNTELLRRAEERDDDEQRQARFEAGLDTLAFRKPVSPRNVGTPAQDAALKRLGIERQGRQDEMAEFLNDARVKAYLAKANAPAKTLKPDTHAQKLEDDENDAKSIRLVILKRFSDKLSGSGITEEMVNAMPKAGAEKLLQEMQSGRAVAAAFARQDDAQDFSAGQKEIDRKHTEDAETRGRTVNGRGLALDAASAKNVREIDANVSNLDAALGTLERLHSKYKGRPLAELVDQDGEIATAVENAQAAYRVQANLGVPSGKDAEMSNAAVNDPARFKALLLGRGPASWSVMRRTAREQANAKARSYMQQSPAAPAGPSGGQQTVRVRRKSDNKTISLPAEKAAKYLADPGFEEVR